MKEDLESMSFVQRVVLCGLVDLSTAGETPANSAELRAAATECLAVADADVMGRVSEADVMRALNGLADSPLVDETRPDDSSPVGKGRPVYELDVGTARVREELSEDDRLASLFE